MIREGLQQKFDKLGWGKPKQYEGCHEDSKCALVELTPACNDYFALNVAGLFST